MTSSSYKSYNKNDYLWSLIYDNEQTLQKNCANNNDKNPDLKDVCDNYSLSHKKFQIENQIVSDEYRRDISSNYITRYFTVGNYVLGVILCLYAIQRTMVVDTLQPSKINKM